MVHTIADMEGEVMIAVKVIIEGLVSGFLLCLTGKTLFKKWMAFTNEEILDTRKTVRNCGQEYQQQTCRVQVVM